MIALDMNVLARLYVDDPSDPESARHSPIAWVCAPWSFFKVDCPVARQRI